MLQRNVRLHVSAAADARPSPKVCDIAVVGGGLGGLALAAGLRSRNFDVKLFEAAPQLRTSTSTMIGLGQSAETCLDSLHPAIVPQLKARGSKCRMFTTCLRADRSQPMTMNKIPELGRYTCRWSEVQQVLAEVVPPEIVECGYRTTGYTEDQERVHVHFKGQPDVEARFVVAADGLRSPLRSTMLPQDPRTRYLGQMNWSMLLHNPGGSVVAAHEPDEAISFMDYMENDKRTCSCVVSDAGGGYTFISIATRSATPAFTPDPAHPSQPGVGGKGCPGSKARLEAMLDKAGWDVPLRCVQATPESSIFERALLDRVPLDELGATMSSPGGRVVLLGDAAHAMHPGPGQGGRTAFEDAHTLAQLLDQYRGDLLGWTHTHSSGGAGVVLGDRQALDQVVSRYNHARLARVCRTQRFSAEGCGLASIRDAARPKDVANTGPVQVQRAIEFLRWMDQYPDNTSGDPASVYWKPPVAMHQRLVRSNA